MQQSRRLRRIAPIAIVGAAGLVLAGCGAPGAPGGGSAGNGDGDNAGRTITVYGPIVDDEARLLEQSWDDWEEQTGITVQYEGSRSFEEQLGIRAQAGNPPDVAIFPQPGSLADFANRGFLKPAPQAVADNANEYWSEDWVKYGTVGDTFYGAPLMASVKGWIWYSPTQFQEWGVVEPSTWDELITLTATIQSATGTPPWCIGFESGGASGWPGTDWIEDLVLRQSGPDVYDRWVEGDVKFADPEIVAAFDAFAEIALDPQFVNASFGDVRSVNSTAFGDVAASVANGSCALTHQASFLAGFFPEGTDIAPDGDVWAFMTPGVTANENAVTGGGEIVAAFSEDSAVQEFLTYLSSPEWANSRVALDGVVSANSGLDPASATSPILQESIRILQDPSTTFRFDASDLMPGAVGAGTFFKGMVDWVNGTPTATVLAQIDAGWPSE